MTSSRPPSNRSPPGTIGDTTSPSSRSGNRSAAGPPAPCRAALPAASGHRQEERRPLTVMPSRDLRQRRRRPAPRIHPLPRLPARAGRAARRRLRARPALRHRDRRYRLVRRRQCSIGDGSPRAARPGPGARRDGERSSHHHLTRRNRVTTSRPIGGARRCRSDARPSHSSRRSTPPGWTPTGNGLQRGQFCWPPLDRTVGRQRAATWPPLGRISWPPTGYTGPTLPKVGSAMPVTPTSIASRVPGTKPSLPGADGAVPPELIVVT